MQNIRQYDVCNSCKHQKYSALGLLNIEEAEGVFCNSLQKHYNKGDVIFTEGNRIQLFYCIKKGVVKLQKKGINGSEQIVNLLSEGDIFGIQSILLHETAPLSVIAVNKVDVCEFPASVLFKAIESNSRFTTKLMEDMCRRLERSNIMLADMAYKTVRARLSQLLLYLEKRFGIDKDGCIDLILSREEIANTVGTARETIIRLLSELNKRNYIRLNKKKIKILLPQQLSEIVHK